MTEPARTRRVAVRKWTCPNHPDGPPTLPADGYEREEMTFEEAYRPDEVTAIVEVVDRARAHGGEKAAGIVERLLGTCCLGHEWKTVGYEDVPVGRFEALLLELRPLVVSAWSDRSVLLSELARGSGSGDVRIPLVFDGNDPGDEQPKA